MNISLNDNQRRNFLRKLVLAGPATTLASVGVPKGTRAKPAYNIPTVLSYLPNYDRHVAISEIPELFSFNDTEDQDVALLNVNSANLSPSFKRVDDIMTAATQDVLHDVSFTYFSVYGSAAEEARTKVGIWLNAPEEKTGNTNSMPTYNAITIVKNCTEANNVIVTTLTKSLDENDAVVIWGLNHRTNYQAWEHAACNGTQFTIATVSLPRHPKTQDDLIVPFLEEIDRLKHAGKNVRMVTFSWMSNKSGLVLPCKELTAAIHSLKNMHGDPILVHVDGAQAAGILDVDLQDIDVDSFSCSLHKWPCGPKMTGILYMKTSMSSQLLAPVWTYNNNQQHFSNAMYGNYQHLLDKPVYRFQHLSQHNDATLVAVGETAAHHIMLHRSQSGDHMINRMCDHVRTLTDNAMESLNYYLSQSTFDRTWRFSIPATDATKEFRATIVILEIQGADASHYDAIIEDLYTHKVIGIDRRFRLANVSGIRFSLHFYLTKSDVDDVCRAVAHAVHYRFMGGNYKTV